MAKLSQHLLVLSRIRPDESELSGADLHETRFIWDASKQNQISWKPIENNPDKTHISLGLFRLSQIERQSNTFVRN